MLSLLRDYEKQIEKEEALKHWTAFSDSYANVTFCFTSVFFNEYNLHPFLNTDCKNMIQFGAASGNTLKSFAEKGWQVVGYDYCDQSIQILNKKGIPAKKVDLNVDCYEPLLKNDLNQPNNIIAVRILQYLEPEQLKLFLFNLIKYSAPGSTFFLIGTFVSSNKSEPKATRDIPLNYVATFFAPRTDIEFLFHSTTKENHIIQEQEQIQKKFVEQTLATKNDEILVVRKRQQ